MKTVGSNVDPQTPQKLNELYERFASRAKPIRVVKKSQYWHQRAAGRALYLVTLGGQNRYISDYVTTLGHTIYVPDDFDSWPAHRALEVLRHEAVHVQQFERYGVPTMVLLYGVLPLPMGLCWFRARLEWEAYEESLRAIYEIEGRQAAHDPELHAEIIRRFVGPDYGFMWPFPKTIQRWIDKALKTIDQENLRSTTKPSQS